MHQLIGANDGIDRARLDTQRTANAVGFVNDSNQQRAVMATCRVERELGGVQQGSQLLDASLPTRRATIDGGAAACYRIRIGTATIVATFCALRLWQDSVNGINQ